MISDRYFTKEEIEKHLMTTARGSPPLDILIRTSGVKRLSDFFLWQVRLYFHVIISFGGSADVSLVLREYTNPVYLDILA